MSIARTKKWFAYTCVLLIDKGLSAYERIQYILTTTLLKAVTKRNQPEKEIPFGSKKKNLLSVSKEHPIENLSLGLILHYIKYKTMDY